VALIKNILITGGSGYLAGRLGEYLSKNKFNVRLVSRKKNLLTKNSSKINWNNNKSIKNNFKNIQCIVHAAGPNYRECHKNYKTSKKFYDATTKKIIKIANECKINKIIFFSSTMVYDQKSNCITEKSKKYSDSSYAKLNLIAEKHILNHMPEAKIKRIVVRLSNAVGVPLHKKIDCWELLCNEICKTLITKNKIVLKTNGQQKKNFIAISEISQKIMYLIKSNKNKLIINLISNKSFKVIEMATFIKLIYEKKYKKKGGLEIGKDIDEKNYPEIKSIFKFQCAKNTRQQLKNEITNTLIFCKKIFK
jgi:UDP-glucose 4-epimerase